MECSKIRLSNDNKRCFYINNNCTEQYKTCELYEQSEEVLDKETCESIVIENDDLNKCVFTEGTGGAKGTCRKTRKTCSDFNYGLIYDKCLNLKPYIEKTIFDIDNRIECRFSNNVCKTELRSCLDIYGLHNEDKELCKTTKTSSPNIKCVFIV